MKDTYATPEEFVKDYNKLRLDSGDKWFGGTFKVGDMEVRVKTYRTWNARFDVNGLHAGGACHTQIGKWKAELLDGMRCEA